jgi:phosphomevalonate kinase
MTKSEEAVVRVGASAPGKLVLSGEYAVLDGAPAVAVAVNRRACVTVDASTAAWHSVTSPGHFDTEGRFEAAGGGIEWLAGGREYALVEHVWSALGFVAPAPLALELDTRAFLDADTGIKLGIGSSAALAVALAAALAAVGEVRGDTFPAALDGHRRLQGGLGSGVDVACSRLGGLIEYSLQAAPGRRLDWPQGLHMAVFWVGAPASTAERIGRLQGTSAKPSRAALAAASGRIAAAWASGSAAAVVVQYRDYVRALREFSDEHALGIFESGHAELAAAAETAGLVYKPCGAGGGDTGVCLGTDAGALDEFLAGEAASKAHCPDMRLEPLGVEVRSGGA